MKKVSNNFDVLCRFSYDSIVRRKIRKYITPVSQQLTLAWFQNDWSNDQVFMIWQMNVTDSSKYAGTFIPFAKMMKKMGVENSFGLGYPILGKNNDYTHFAWSGHRMLNRFV